MKNTVKINLDIVITVLFVSLLFPYNTGLVYHEIAGISLAAMIILHLILNSNWIVNVSKNLLSGKFKAKTILLYILNIGLFLGITVIIITGLMISNVIFNNNYNESLAFIHKWSSYITVLMIAIHLGLHAKYLINSFKKYFLVLKHRVLKRFS